MLHNLLSFEKRWGRKVKLCSVGKESACNAGDPGLISGSGRSAGEGIGYPLQYSWASLVAQLVKNPPAIQETWVWPLGWEDPLEKGKAAHSSILVWRIPWTVCGVYGVAKSWTRLSDFYFHISALPLPQWKDDTTHHSFIFTDLDLTSECVI